MPAMKPRFSFFDQPWGERGTPVAPDTQTCGGKKKKGVFA
jgi:hypothetical protein